MNSDAYKSILPNIKIHEVPEKSMSSHQTYNQLMISPDIFNFFSAYSHILIHEPDSIVLKDDLDFWCAKGFDYIGAPWFTQNTEGTYILQSTGNFGLSLLQTHSIRKLFHDNPRWYSATMIIRDMVRGLRGKEGTPGDFLAQRIYMKGTAIFFGVISYQGLPHHLMLPHHKMPCTSLGRHILSCVPNLAKINYRSVYMPGPSTTLIS